MRWVAVLPAIVGLLLGLGGAADRLHAGAFGCDAASRVTEAEFWQTDPGSLGLRLMQPPEPVSMNHLLISQCHNILIPSQILGHRMQVVINTSNNCPGDEACDFVQRHSFLAAFMLLTSESDLSHVFPSLELIRSENWRSTESIFVKRRRLDIRFARAFRRNFPRISLSTFIDLHDDDQRSTFEEKVSELFHGRPLESSDDSWDWRGFFHGMSGDYTACNESGDWCATKAKLLRFIPRDKGKPDRPLQFSAQLGAVPPNVVLRTLSPLGGQYGHTVRIEIPLD